MKKSTKEKKFKLTELDAKDAPVKDIEWEGEELGAQSDIKLQDDKGVGQPIVLRFFDFAANPQVFAQHKPTALELFSSHRMGMEALIWKDGLTPHKSIEPRLRFSKDRSQYQFIISCIPNQALVDVPHTLDTLLHGRK